MMVRIKWILGIIALPALLYCQQVEVGGVLTVDSIEVTTGLVKHVSNPTSDSHGATKAYVDNSKMAFAQDIADAGFDTFIEDIDGNRYRTTKIGSQRWMAENLRVTKYNDGTAIAYSTGSFDLNTPAYCFYNNDPATYEETYGALYNFHVVSSPTLNVCPEGWHIPTQAEWGVLVNYIGGSTVAGGKMKSTGISLWNNPNVGATNDTGFAGLPGGLQSIGGGIDESIKGIWWSSTEFNSIDAYFLSLSSSSGGSLEFDIIKITGLSLRCVMD